MKVVVLAIGKCNDAPIAALTRRYLDRCAWPVTVREMVAKKRENETVRTREERAALSAALPRDAHKVALDARGEDLSSEAFAEMIARRRDDGRNLAFMIGGAQGLGDELRRRADAVVRFGAATWPHLLVRAMLAEQLYRASSILAGHPYHRGD